MTTIASGPDTVTVSSGYLHTIEEHARAADERADKTEMALLVAQQETRIAYEALVEARMPTQEAARHDAIHQVPQKYDEMRWRQRFIVLCMCVLGGLGIMVELIIVPHWNEIQEWFR